MTLDQVLSRLYELADPAVVAKKQKQFGIETRQTLGVFHKDLKVLAKEIGTDSQLALELFDTGIYEARLLCSKIFDPKDLTEELMEKWVATFDTWEITDSFCSAVFSHGELALRKAEEWSRREPEFEKRSGFVIMACYTMADKKAPNEVFEAFFPHMVREAWDNRIYVKKAINWALRNIGKRNPDLRQTAIGIALEIQTQDTPSARWIARDALKELQQPDLKLRNYPRKLYGSKP